MRTIRFGVRVLCFAAATLTGCDSGDGSPIGGASSDGGSTAGANSSVGGANATAGTSSGGSAGATVPVLERAAITVSGSAPKPVSPTFFGQNYWSWVPAWGDPVAGVQAEASELGLQILRAGGANNDRQEPVPFTLAEVDDFVAFSRAVGAEPLLQVPAIKTTEGTEPGPQDAAALVTYVNTTKDYGIRYFSIGNEPDLYTEQNLADASYTASAFCTKFKALAQAMRAVDPSIEIMGPELSWKYVSGTNDWLTPFLQQCGEDIDVVAVHRYPLPPTECTESAAYADAPRFRQTLRDLRAKMAAAGHADKPLAITEANITWDGEPAKSTMPASPGTFPAALWVADSLGVALEEGLHNISYWSLSEGWTLGFFSGTTPRPAFHVLKLFARRFGTQVLQVTGSPPSVSIYAGRNPESGTTTLFVVNKGTNELDLTVDLTDLPRSEVPNLLVAPATLLVAEFADDGSAPTLTRYSRGMTAPESVEP